MATVNQHKKIGHLHTVEDIPFDYALQAVAVILAAAGIAIAGQIDYIPAVVHQKVIDKHGLSRGRRSHGKSFAAGEHIDERRLTYVRASDKGILVAALGRALAYTAVAYYKAGGIDEHILCVI